MDNCEHCGNNKSMIQVSGIIHINEGSTPDPNVSVLKLSNSLVLRQNTLALYSDTASALLQFRNNSVNLTPADKKEIRALFAGIMEAL